MRRLLQLEARRDEGADGEPTAVETCEKRSRTELTVGLGSLGFEHKIMEIHAGKKIYAKNLLKEAAMALSVDNEWLNESPRKVDVALLQESRNMQCPGMMVRRAVKAGLADDWSELTRSEELNPWKMAKLKESYYQARQEDEQRKSIVQKVLQKITDSLGRITAPVQEQASVTLSYVRSLSCALQVYGTVSSGLLRSNSCLRRQVSLTSSPRRLARTCTLALHVSPVPNLVWMPPQIGC